MRTQCAHVYLSQSENGPSTQTERSELPPGGSDFVPAHGRNTDIALDPPPKQLNLAIRRTYILQRKRNFNTLQIQRDQLHPMFFQFGFRDFEPSLGLEFEAVDNPR